MPELVKEIRIYVEYKTATSNGRNDFDNLQEMKIWLDKHPDLAKVLGYVPK